MVQSLYLRQVVRRHKSEQRGSFFLRWQNFKSDWGWKSSRMAAICSPPRSAHSRLICQTLTWLWLMQSSDTGLLLWAWALDKMYRFHSEATALVHERRVWCWRWRRWMWRDDSHLSVCEPGSNQVMERGVLSHLSHLENDLCCCRKRLVYLSSFFFWSPETPGQNFLLNLLLSFTLNFFFFSSAKWHIIWNILSGEGLRVRTPTTFYP